MRRHAALRDARLATVSTTFKSATIVRKSLSSHGPAIFSGQTNQIGDHLREPIIAILAQRYSMLRSRRSHPRSVPCERRPRNLRPLLVDRGRGIRSPAVPRTGCYVWRLPQSSVVHHSKNRPPTSATGHQLLCPMSSTLRATSCTLHKHQRSC